MAESQAKGLWEGLREGAVEHVGATLAGLAITTAIAGGTAVWATLKTWVVYEIPAGIVVASVAECRDLKGGWIDFEAAAGRFIVGAGSYSLNPGVSKAYDVFKTENTNPRAGLEKATGGEKRHQLRSYEMPPVASKWRSDLGRGDQTALLNNTGYNDDAGYKSFSILPPYVALYYCKKT